MTPAERADIEAELAELDGMRAKALEQNDWLFMDVVMVLAAINLRGDNLRRQLADAEVER